MKYLFTLLTLLFMGSALLGQNKLFNELRQVIYQHNPSFDLNEKLIGFVMVNGDNAENLSTLRIYEHVQSVYQNAKLKGGSQGVLLLGVCKAENVNKLSVECQQLQIISHTEIPELIQAGMHNGIFDNKGKLIYSNLSDSLAFKSVKQLIIR